MKKTWRRALLSAAALALAFGLCACADTPSNGADDGTDPGGTPPSVLDEAALTETKANPETEDPEDLAENETWKNFVTITCGETIEVENSDESDMSVSVSGTNITVTSSKKMVLTLRGTLNGSVLVTKPDGKLKLVLDGVTIRSQSGPAINLQTEKRVFVEVADGTANSLTDGAEHPTMPDGSKTKAALFSEEQMIFSGNGTLNVTGNHSHAIASDDYLRFWSGTYVLGAVDDGLRANDAIIVDGGSIEAEAGSDGMECERGYVVFNGGKAELNATDCGIKTSTAETYDPYIDVLNGMIGITAGDDGLKSQSDIRVRGGCIQAEAANNGIKAAGTISVSDGYVFAKSSGNDAFDADGGIAVSGGTAVALASSSDGAAFNANAAGFSVAGGMIAAGANTETAPADSSAQCSLLYDNTNRNALFRIENENGEEVLTMRYDATYGKLLFSVPGLVSGESYSLRAGGTADGAAFHGLGKGGTYSGSGEPERFTAQAVTRI